MRWDLITNDGIQTAPGDRPDDTDSKLSRGHPEMAIEVPGGEFKFSFYRLTGGRSDGVDCLEINTGAIRVLVVPTRGMSLWKAWCKRGQVGWQSPVEGPVHPSLVPIYDPNGLGWLEGFDELMVRCGLQSNGAPDFGSKGELQFPLHGRIGNLPTHRLSIVVDKAAGTLDVIGSVIETRFHIQSLQLDAHYRFHVNKTIIDCTDTVTNRRSQPASMQMLYHINLGSPILEAGAKVVAALDEIAPRNPHAAKDIDRWDTYNGPTPGYTEQVYFARPLTDTRGWTTTMLHNADRTRAVAVRFDTHSLPYLSLWKNTVAIEDGYVTGIEPATGFPNPRSFEDLQGRLVGLAGGQSRSFTWQIEPLENSAAIENAINEVQSLQRSECKVHREPKSGWSS